jgi:hypothetical protein
MKQALVKRYHLSADRISVMQAGYNPLLSSPLPPWSPPEDDQWTVGYLGSYMDASLEVLVEALHKLGRPEVKLILAGRGMSKASEHHTNPWPNTTVIESARYSTFAEVARNVDLWVVPLTDRFTIDYCWQLKMPMYFASGRPIVRTGGKALDDSGLGEYVYQTGSTSEEFAATLQQIFTSPEEAAQRAQAGKTAIERDGSWKSVALRLLSDLEALSHRTP